MSKMRSAGRQARKAGALVLGIVVVLAGIALLPLPGPGMLVIIVGLIILASEFDWAQRWLDYAVEKAAGATTKVHDSKSGRILLGLSGLVLLTLGVGVIVVAPKWMAAGFSLILAGIIGLCTLLPGVQDWIARKAVTGLDDTDDVD